WRDAPDVPYAQQLLKDKPDLARAIFHLEAGKSGEYNRSRFALVGNFVSLRRTFELARDRSAENATNAAWTWPELALDKGEVNARDAAARWPEVALAHSDCFACHHELELPGFRQQRGFGYLVPGLEPLRVAPGRPVVRTWPLAAVKAGIDWHGTSAKERAAAFRDP